MLKYLKLFDRHNNYEAFLETSEFLKPNVSHCILEREVHYNPFDLTISGKFTVPSRLFELAGSGDDSGGGIDEPIGPILAGINNIGDCYGLDSGIRQGGDYSITFNDNDNTPILNISNFQDIETVTDSSDGKEYRVISFKCLWLGVDENGDGIDYETKDGENYYYANPFEFYGRLDSEGVLEPGTYEWENNDYVFVPQSMPLMTVRNKRVIIWDKDTGNETYEIRDINCIQFYYDENEGDWFPESEDMYDGDFSYIESNSYFNMIIPLENFENIQHVKSVFTSVKIDGEEIDLDELCNGTNLGWYELEEGEHSIVYRMNKDEAMYGGYLRPGLLSGVAIEELSLDRRIKGTYMYEEFDEYNNIYRTAFDSCALLGTDEDTLKKVCTTKMLIMEENESGQMVPAKTPKIKPFIMECEFDDDDDKILDSNNSGTQVVNDTYFAVHSGMSGMHSCADAGGGGIEPGPK